MPLEALNESGDTVGPFPTSSSDRTTRHNAARNVSTSAQVNQNGLSWELFDWNFEVEAAAKRCMFTRERCIGNGVPDIVYAQPGTGELEGQIVYSVWEVKSASIDGAAVVARTEALWCVEKMQEAGLNAKLGDMYDFPVQNYLGDSVWTPEPGVVLYGREESDATGQSSASAGSAAEGGPKACSRNSSADSPRRSAEHLRSECLLFQCHDALLLVQACRMGEV